MAVVEKTLKKQLQKELLAAAKRGERILDLLVEYQRIYKLDLQETKALVSKAIKDKMFQQEKQYKTVVSRGVKHLAYKKLKPSTSFELD